MPITIGIIGAENSHTAAIAKAINVEKSIKGVKVEYVWGETSEFAKNAAKGKAHPIQPSSTGGEIDIGTKGRKKPTAEVNAQAAPFFQMPI